MFVLPNSYLVHQIRVWICQLKAELRPPSPNHMGGVVQLSLMGSHQQSYSSTSCFNQTKKKMETIRPCFWIFLSFFGGLESGTPHGNLKHSDFNCPKANTYLEGRESMLIH